MFGRKKSVRLTYPDVSRYFSYSKDGSRPFWNAVNSLKNESNRQELYSLGVALQNMEEYVLRQLQNAIRDDK